MRFLDARRIAASLMVLALGASLVGTCPCAVASHDACPPASEPAAAAGGCCDGPATGFRPAPCCDASEKGEVKAVATAVRAQGPASILDVHEGWNVQVLIARPPLDTAWHLLPPPRAGGPPILRI